MSDPLDALRSPIVPLAPAPAFAARLRRRIELTLTDRSEVGDLEEDPMTDVLHHQHRERNGVHHGDVSYITLALPDAAAARQFYGGVLGWTFSAGQVDLVVPEVGLWPGPEWREGVSAGAILAWRVDDINTAVVAVRGEGGTASDPVERPYGLEAECSDGAGLRFWLHQLPPPAGPADPDGARPGDISYLVLRVADLERAERLFSSVLGWTYEPGNVGVHVTGPAPMTGMSQGDPGVVLCFQVDDIAAAVDRVTTAGGRSGPVETRPYGLEAECADDQGVAFFLHQF
ncbi:MAG TPA: hypothetical protein VKR22_14990 [Acidimicrobiales bacterium]|nr:hypothetical protein [Acidimicrobiales bacterium]